MNEKNHWNTIAPDYNAEIFDVFESDKNRILGKYFQKHKSDKHLAVDFGCGNGKAFRFLAPLFERVIGFDISQKLLDQANLLPFTNVSTQQADLTKGGLSFPKADFLFCCNVAILSTVQKNLALLKNSARALKKGGIAVFVIPSLESMLFSYWRLFDWYEKEGVLSHKISPDEWAGFDVKKADIVKGLVSINGVVTKHYTREEIEVVFRRCGFQVTAIEKIEYSWSSEFAKPPAWMKEPYPWDWLVECTNGKPY